MTDRGVFSPGTAIWLVAVGCLCFAGAAYFSIYGEGGVGAQAGANSFSHSAVGHRAFVETLERMDVPVVVSRSDSRAKAGWSALLVLAEPNLRAVADGTLAELLEADTLLLVLPKWRGRPQELNPEWLESARPLPEEAVRAVLNAAVSDGDVWRPDEPSTWRTGSLGVVPTLDAPQLIVSSELRPIVATDQGTLIGELAQDGRLIWVLSDPDILSNHGLGRGDNAVLAAAMVEALRPSGEAVVFDETVHGFRRDSSLWRAILEFPFAIATLQAVAAIVALIWAATGRFGSPVPAERTVKAGKETLLNNTANLLQVGGHGPEILRRYFEATYRDVLRTLRAPRRLDDEALADWVDRVGQARGARSRLRDLRRKVESASLGAGRGGPGLLSAARDLYRWKREMTDGS